MRNLIRTTVLDVLIINKMAVRELNEHIKEGRISKAALHNLSLLRTQIAEVREEEAAIEIENKFKELFK